MNSDSASLTGAIAVVGLACRFPGANTPDEFWQNLRDGRESITFFSPEELLAAGVAPSQFNDPAYVPAKGTVHEVDGFDAGFFGFSAREAALMDPQQRIFLECAWTALEDSGYDSHKFHGTIGVIAGSILSIYLVKNLWPNRSLMEDGGTFQVAVGNDPTFLATSTSYKLDLRGPSVSVGTACSTSLVAVHLACQSLQTFQCDMVLAGGVSVHLPLAQGYRYEKGSILSPDGHCRPFDSAAEGTVSSDGVGVVVLKRLDDALEAGDVIHAIIRGSAMNNDGALKVGFTAPCVEGQKQVIKDAMALAEVDPETVLMVETHGAGTLLGDPIEFSALAGAFGDCHGKRGFCALSSVKSNIGHTDAAAGIAGFIKAVLSVRHREIPPTLHFQEANPQINFRETPFYVNNELVEMRANGVPCCVGVSSFGIGGTNCHVLLEEPPPREIRDDSSARPYELLTLSARTETALETATDRLTEYLEHSTPSALADIGYTLRHGRRSFAHRRFVVCRDRQEAVALLKARDRQTVATAVAPAERRTVVFMFPGLGDHYANMGWEFYCLEPDFRRTVDECAEILKRHLQTDIRDFLFSGREWKRPVLVSESAAAGSSKLDLRAMLGRSRGTDRVGPDQTVVAQPGIFVIEIALAKLICKWGIEPEAMIGHSIGEIAAAYLSGVFSLPDALEVVALRAQLIQTLAKPGAMLAVPWPENKLVPLLPDTVSLGAINAASLCIGSGTEEGITQLQQALQEQGVSCQRLKSAHAYHSRMLSVVVEPLNDILCRIRLCPPGIPFVSCVTGTWITDEQATDPHYWANHVCRTVRFQQGLSNLMDEPRRIFLEVGPGQGLTSHAVSERSRIPSRQNLVIPTMRWSYAQQAELAVLLRGMGLLWLAGISLNTSKFLSRTQQRRVSLPTYPFERKRHWIDAPRVDAIPGAGQLRRNPNVANWFYLPYWKPSIGSVEPLTSDRGWLIFVDEFNVGTRLAANLRVAGESVVTVRVGDGYKLIGDNATVNPQQPQDYQSLLSELRSQSRLPGRIVHLWCMNRTDRSVPSSERFDDLQQLGYFSLMRMLPELCREGVVESIRIEVIANQLFDVSTHDEIIPEKATLVGPAMVAPQEHPGIVCRCIDLDLSPEDPACEEMLLADLTRELKCPPTEGLVAIRKGHRWVPTYEPVQLNAVAASDTPYRQRGVYLLTGGLGGVGMVLADHLARCVQARFVLISRSTFPERPDWDAWIAERGEDDAISRRIRNVRALEEAGAEVLVVTANVANRDAMRRALAIVEKRFGELNGVIHGAGAVGVETFREITQATTSDSESQFVAKVHGLLVLDELLADRKLDFCLLLSSLSAVLGGLGFAAYSAANLFMDAFARRKSRQKGATWTSVNWDSWKLSDIRPAIQGLGASVSEFVMEPEEGATACDRILSQRHLSQIVVSSGDLFSRRRQWIEHQPVAEDGTTSMTVHERPTLSSDYEGPRSELESQLAEIWSELFGISTVGIHDNFFELGGHSLLATQLNARLAARLHVEMSLATLLESPTISQLAVAIVNQQAEAADPALLDKLLEEIGEMSDEDLQRLLAEQESDSTAGEHHE